MAERTLPTIHHEVIIDALAEALVREYLTAQSAPCLAGALAEAERVPLAAVDQAA